MADPKELVRDIANDLTHLEVNTIIKSNITGRKMPGPRHALFDIGKKYAFKLRKYGIDLDEIDELRLGSLTAFRTIRDKAEGRIKELNDDTQQTGFDHDEEAEYLMLNRIKYMCDQIKGIFKALEDGKEKDSENNFKRLEIAGLETENLPDNKPPAELQLDQRERVIIRKAWELGVEEIAMQTVIQIDGDVMTRVQPRFAHGEDEGLHKIHSDGVRTSVEYWTELIKIATDILGSFFSSLRPGR